MNEARRRSRHWQLCKQLLKFLLSSRLLSEKLIIYCECSRRDRERPENRILRKICGAKRGEVKGTWGKLQIKDFHNLQPPSNIATVMKSRLKKRTRHRERKREMRNAYQILVGNP
jgi:hypothetical protein